MMQITIDGETFRVQIDGEATRPALLLCNSLGTTLSLWDGQMQAFLKQFRVIRFDARGHGGSTTAGPYSIGRLSRDALGILDALEIKKAHVLGLSLGGAVAQWLLANAPERVERVVLACTAPKFGMPDGWNQRICAVLTNGMAAIADATMERWFSPTLAPNAIAPIREMLLAGDPMGYAGCCAALRDLDLRQSLHGIDVPALVITGVDDAVISAADTAFLLQVLTNSRHVSLPGRHIVNAEAGAAFTDAVIQFLTAKLPARRRTPAASAKTAAPRGKTTRRASAARQPLAKATTTSRKSKPAAKPASKPPLKTASKAKPAAPKASGKAKTVVPKTLASKKAASKKATSKTAPKKTVPNTKMAKTTVKRTAVAKAKAKTVTKAKIPARRKTTAIAVRGAVKKAATKAKPSKAVTKKATPKTSKRPPTPRRKPAKTPRRPSGRRKT